MRRLLALFVVIVASFAGAQSVTVGATLAPVTPNGFGFGVQLGVPFTSFDLSGQMVDLLARADATMPLDFSVSPSINLGVTAAATIDGIRPYVGTGVGLLFRTIEEQPCWDIAWTIHAGVDVPIADALAFRVDANVAPTLGLFNLGVGVAYTFGN